MKIQDCINQEEIMVESIHHLRVQKKWIHHPKVQKEYTLPPEAVHRLPVIVTPSNHLKTLKMTIMQKMSLLIRCREVQLAME